MPFFKVLFLTVLQTVLRNKTEATTIRLIWRRDEFKKRLPLIKSHESSSVLLMDSKRQNRDGK